MNPLIQGLPVLLAGLMVWAVVAGRLWLKRLTWVSVIRATCIALLGWAGCTALLARVGPPFSLPLFAGHELFFLPSLLAVVLVLPLATVFEARVRREGWAVAWRVGVLRPLLALRPRGLGEWTGAVCVLCAAWLLPQLSFADLAPSARAVSHFVLGGLLVTVCAALAPIVLSFVAVRALRRGRPRARAVSLLTFVVGWCLLLVMVGQQAQAFVQSRVEINDDMQAYLEMMDPCALESLPGETVDEQIESSREMAVFCFTLTGVPQEYLTAPDVREELVLTSEESAAAQSYSDAEENVRLFAERAHWYAGAVALLVAFAAGLALLPTSSRKP